MQARKHASKKSSLALKPRADVTRSPKQGYQWPQKKDSCPTKIFFKKLDLDLSLEKIRSRSGLGRKIF